MQLQVRLKNVKVNFNETDASILGAGFAPDEIVVHIWGRDNADLDGAGWLGGACHTYSMNLPGVTPAINEMLLNYTYTGANVPQFYDLKIDNYEDDAGNPDDQLLGLSCSGTYCAFNGTSCCGFILFGNCIGLNEGDDKRCFQDPWRTNLPYRNGPPCVWFDQGYTGTGTCNNDWEANIETYWRYTKGTSCANAIDLGTLNTAGTLSHFNSNVCYANTHAASPGNDVWYKFTVNQPIGITASLCGIAGAQFDSYLYLYSACGQTVADTANDDACGTQSSLAFSLCQAGDYYLVVDGKTANEQGTFTLTVQDNPNFLFSASIAKQDVSCFGGSDGQITVNVTGGYPPYTYVWNPSSIGNVNSTSGLAGGTYSVSVTDAKGCQATASTVINVPTQITASATGNPVSCGGACDGSASVTAQGGTPGYSYAWNSLPPQQLSNATFLCAGNYIVTVTDTKGCTVTANTNVPNTTTVVIATDSINDVKCFGAANGGIYLTSTGGQLPLTFSWSNNATTEDNVNLGPGSYTITVRDNIGCTAGNTYTISEPPVLTSNISFAFNPRCNAGRDGIVNINVLGGVQPYSYLWSAPTSATTQNLNNVGAGTHTVTVSDANLCTATATATLTQPTPFNISLSTTGLSCYGATNGSASVTVSGETAPYTYFWSNFATTSSTNGLFGGPFSVVIDDANGCDTIIIGTINEPGQIDVSLTTFEPLCADSGNGSINTTIVGGTPPFTYAWNNGAPPVANPTVGSGTFTVTVTDANNCTATETTGVNAPEPFTLNLIGINPGCIGDSSGVITANTNGGAAPLSYTWSASSGSSSQSFLERVKRGYYAVTVTDANGCVATGQVFLQDPQVDPESCRPDNYTVLIPTAFTPNGDNVNDRLVAITKNVQKLELYVYNRWGEKVYENLNMIPGDGWDGSYKGKQQPMGAYVYIFNVEYLNGIRTTDKGTTTLIR
jgi:gliding motility-associated-like protein